LTNKKYVLWNVYLPNIVASKATRPRIRYWEREFTGIVMC